MATFTGTQQEVQDSIKLLEEYYRSEPGIRDQDPRFGSGKAGNASQILNAYAMAGGDTSIIPPSIPSYIASPEFARHIEAGSGPGLRDWLTIAGIVAGPLLAGGAGAAASGATAGTEGALGSGITATAAEGGLGAGLGTTTAGTGLSTGATGATGITAGGGALGTSALAPGFFASEGVGAGGTPPPTGGGSSFAPSGTGTLGELALKAVPGVLGAYASDRQADAYSDLANQYTQFGAPYRQRLSDLYNDPSSFLNSPEVQAPLQQGTNILARSLSTQGNPIGSGNALQELQNFTSNQLFSKLGQEKDRLGGFGGLTQYQSAAPDLASLGIGQQGNVYQALGGAAADVFGTGKRNQTLDDLLRSYYG